METRPGKGIVIEEVSKRQETTTMHIRNSSRLICFVQKILLFLGSPILVF